MLDVLRLLGGLFRNMNSATTKHRSARRKGRQFREGHPNRHKLCSLFVSLRCIPEGIVPCHRASMPRETQRVVKATILLTVFG
jgi:hypothetical protein